MVKGCFHRFRKAYWWRLVFRRVLQFVRKVSSYRKPSKVNEAAFELAIEEIAKSTQKLLGSISIKSTV